MKSIKELTGKAQSSIRYVLSDIDDTITTEARLLPVALQALYDLKAAGYTVILVSGRCAGHCDIVAREWPVDAVIAESGAICYYMEQPAVGTQGRPCLRQMPHPTAVPNTDPVLTRIRERVFAEVPGARLSKDFSFRLYEQAFDYAEESPELPYSAAEAIHKIALEEGARANISSIHVNNWIGAYDKVIGAEYFLGQLYGWRPGEEADREVFYIGDSPIDQTMWARFPVTAAVANIHRYQGRITHYPAYVTKASGGEGFAEAAAVLINK
jgi:hydroxymethylpyrimidine pyrophosphatase-like HAD family hydrolase